MLENRRRALYIKARDQPLEVFYPLPLGTTPSLRSSGLQKSVYGLNSRFVCYKPFQPRFETDVSGNVRVAEIQSAESTGATVLGWLWKIRPFLKPTLQPEVDIIPHGFGTSNDGNRIAIWTHDKIQIWNLESGTVVHELLVVGVSSLALDARGRFVCFGTNEGKVYQWQLAAPTRVVELFDLSSTPTQALAVTQIDIQPQSTALVASTLEKAQVWHLQEHEGQNTASRRPYYARNTTYSLARFDGDGNTLLLSTRRELLAYRNSRLHEKVDLDDPVATGEYNDQLVGLAMSGKQLRLLVGENEFPINDADGTVRCAAFSPHSDSFAAGLSDGSVRIWNTETKHALALPIICGSTPIKQIRFCDDNLFIVMDEVGQFTRVQLPGVDIPAAKALNRRTELVTGMHINGRRMIGEKRKRLPIDEWMKRYQQLYRK